MSDALRLTFGRRHLPIPAPLWRRAIPRLARSFGRALRSFTPEHHAVRNYVVEHIPRTGAPIPPEAIADGTGVTLPRVVEILDKLDRKRTFLCRDESGAVSWAFPVTAAATPHHLTFSTGERIDAAWGLDAQATPFVQGRLRHERISVTVRTECAHCAEPIELAVDDAMRCRVATPGARPMISLPLVNVRKLKDPTILDALWRRSVFFWSEEHARDYRFEVRSLIATLDQAAFINRAVQGALFGFTPWSACNRL